MARHLRIQSADGGMALVFPVDNDEGLRIEIRNDYDGKSIGLLHIREVDGVLFGAIGGWDEDGEWLPNQAGDRSWLALVNRYEDAIAEEEAYRKQAERDPLIDTESSASRQHFIDTGEYLTVPDAIAHL